MNKLESEITVLLVFTVLKNSRSSLVDSGDINMNIVQFNNKFKNME